MGLVIFFAVLPSFVWLAFYLKEDSRRPEPKRLITYVFLSGAAVTVVVIGVQFLFNAAASGIVNEYGLIHLFVTAAVEEFFKFLAAYLAIRKSPFFDEPLDAMIYVITAAMGFAVVENVLAAIGVNNGAANPNAALAATLEVTALRFIGATLLHALSSGTVGYFWALGLIKKKIIGLVLLGLLLGTAIHVGFNYLILSFEKEGFVYPVAFLVVVALFVLGDFEKLKKYDKL